MCLIEVNGKQMLVFFWERIAKEKPKIYVKWTGYDNSFNSWIDRKYAIM